MGRFGNKDDRYAAKLLRKHRKGTLTPQERVALDGWYLHRARTAQPLSDPEVYARRMQELDEAFPFTEPVPVKRLTRWLPYAAAVAIFIAVGSWLAIRYHQSEISLAAAEILPGGNRATLTLADGRVINLDEAQTGIVVGAEDITYNDGASSVVMLSEDEASGEMLALTTPKGGTYQITLPDGSTVWLNSASTLRYPSRFTSGERVVELDGEAYFTVTGIVSPIEGGRNGTGVGRGVKQPFKVVTNNQTVQVLGTQFNISAYTDDPETKTTLVEGKVKVTLGTEKGSPQKGLSDFRTFGLPEHVLTAGQQAITRGAQLEIREVDTEHYASWKDGYFSLSGSIPEILKQISRWYDLEVVYEGMPDDRIEVAASIPRDIPLGDILLALQEYDAGLKYRLMEINDGRRLVVFR